MAATLPRAQIVSLALILALTVALPSPGQAQTPTAPSPGWSRAIPPGPDSRVKITEAYAKLVGRDAFFWAWPLVNVYNRRLYFASVK
jgi:hypothetical protein